MVNLDITIAFDVMVRIDRAVTIRVHADIFSLAIFFDTEAFANVVAFRVDNRRKQGYNRDGFDLHGLSVRFCVRE